jgi:hypothetical protein
MEFLQLRVAATVTLTTLLLSSAAFATPVPSSWDGVVVMPDTGANMLGWGFGRIGSGNGQGSTSSDTPAFFAKTALPITDSQDGNNNDQGSKDGDGGSNGGSEDQDITVLAVDPPAAAVAVPEPLTLSLFGAGLAGAIGMRRRKKAAK